MFVGLGNQFGRTDANGTGWTLVGVTKATAANRYFARKTGTGTWTVYQIA